MRGKCYKTSKTTYTTLEAAELAIKAIHRKDQSAHKEQEIKRAYRCEFCNLFHLTSKEQSTHPVRLKYAKEFIKYLKPKTE